MQIVFGMQFDLKTIIIVSLLLSVYEWIPKYERLKKFRQILCYK